MTVSYMIYMPSNHSLLTLELRKRPEGVVVVLVGVGRGFEFVCRAGYICNRGIDPLCHSYLMITSIPTLSLKRNTPGKTPQTDYDSDDPHCLSDEVYTHMR